MKERKITLEEAINRIWEGLYLHEKQNHYNDMKPYFFLVGAGVSTPDIKSANEIISECQDLVKEMYLNEPKRFIDLQNDSEKVRDNKSKYYSFWLEAAFKNKINRQRYLEMIINNAKISAANLMLAQILISKKIAISIITPNFDDKLLQALILYGEHNVYEADNLMDNMAINPVSKQIQILHVHGTYRFYDCCNLENEINRVSNEMGIRSTASVLDDYLKYMVPIVIGYSGWENDVIMSRIKERILYPLPCNIIWFCYDNSSYNSLPEWLKLCEDICFVLPEVENECNYTSMLDSFSNNSEEYNAKLKATDVFNAIISKFSIPMPSIFANPFKYYSELFSKLTTDEKDVFNLDSWINRFKYVESNFTELDRVKQTIDEAVAKKNIKEINDGFNDLLKLEMVPQADISYILVEHILPMLKSSFKGENQENVLKFFEFSLEIYSLEQDVNLKIETKRKILELLLNKINRLFKNSRGIYFYDKVISITIEKDDYIQQRLMAKGMKSDLLGIKDKSILHMEILEEGVKYKENEEVARILIVNLKKMAMNLEVSKDIILIQIKSIIELSTVN